MLLTEPVLEIETPRNHSPETQERLPHLLASGVTGSPDPRRPDFFEIEDKTRVFYIHIAETSGKVTLLAVWNLDAK
jgi:hypothetical protein